MLGELVMARVYMYADETGDLGYGSDAPYFGIGTATYRGEHSQALWAGLELRTQLEAKGVRVQHGLHAKNDSRSTRSAMFDVIAHQAPRFDTTFLYKENAYVRVQQRGPVYLYQQAIYLHFKEILRQVSCAGDEVFVIAGHLQTNAKRAASYQAVRAVCSQIATDRTVVPCVWDAPSSWGIQVADYGLWSTQRVLLGRTSPWHVRCVQPTLKSVFKPWGTP